MSVLGTKLKKVTAAALAVTTIAGGMTLTATSADAYYRGRGRGAAIGLGVLGGVVAGAAIANAAGPRYGYGYYDDAPAYVEGPVCHWERQKVYLDDYTYKIRRVRVCD